MFCLFSSVALTYIYLVDEEVLCLPVKCYEAGVLCTNCTTSHWCRCRFTTPGSELTRSSFSQSAQVKPGAADSWQVQQVTSWTGNISVKCSSLLSCLIQIFVSLQVSVSVCTLRTGSFLRTHGHTSWSPTSRPLCSSWGGWRSPDCVTAPSWTGQVRFSHEGTK